MQLDEVRQVDRTYYGLDVYELHGECWAVGAEEEIPQAVGAALIELASGAGAPWIEGLHTLLGGELAELVAAAAEAQRGEPLTSLLVLAI